MEPIDGRTPEGWSPGGWAAHLRRVARNAIPPRRDKLLAQADAVEARAKFTAEGRDQDKAYADIAPSRHRRRARQRASRGA